MPTPDKERIPMFTIQCNTSTLEMRGAVDARAVNARALVIDPCDLKSR